MVCKRDLFSPHIVFGCRRHKQQPQLRIFPMDKLKATPQMLLGSLAAEVTCLEGIGLVLFLAVCGTVAANHSLDNSRLGLMTKWQTLQNSMIQNWRDRLTCITSEKSCRIYTFIYESCRIYTSMDITSEKITVLNGKGQGDKCKVVGQNSFASPTSCRLCVWSTVVGHSDTIVMMPVVSFKCAVAFSDLRD